MELLVNHFLPKGHSEKENELIMLNPHQKRKRILITRRNQRRYTNVFQYFQNLMIDILFTILIQVKRYSSQYTTNSTVSNNEIEEVIQESTGTRVRDGEMNVAKSNDGIS